MAAILASGLFIVGAPGWARVDPGDVAPAFSLDDRSGRRVGLAEYRGRVVVVTFWASWCAGCTSALPGLDAMAREHGSAGLTVLAVNIDREPAKAERLLADRVPAPAMILLRDPEGELLARFGAEGMPAQYVIDRAGRVVLAEVGYGPEKLRALAHAVAALL